MTLVLVGLAWVIALAAAGAFGAPWWMGAAWVAVASPALLLSGPLKGRYGLAGACVAAALLAGWRFSSITHQDPSWIAAVGEEVRLTGVVESEPDRGQTTAGYTVRVTRIEYAGASSGDSGGGVLLYLNQFTDLLPGDSVTVEGDLELPPRFDGFDYRAYLARHGIAATMYRPRLLETSPGGPAPDRWLTSQRLRLDRSLQRSLPEPEASLAAGIAFGRDDGLSRTARERFNRSGLRHLVAVSGSNVSLVVALTYAVAIPLVGRRWAWLPAAFTLAAYLGAAGLSASVLRSGVMASILLFGSVIGRPQSGLPALFAAIIAMTAISPSLAADPGFQLSATATAGLITLSPWLSHGLLSATAKGQWLSLPRWLCESAALTVSASIATAPVMWVTFEQVSLISPFANAVVQPVFAVAFWASLATSALGVISRDLGETAGVIAYYPLAFISACANAFAGPRWAAVGTPAAGAEWATAAYAALTGLGLLAYRFRPAPLVERPTISRIRTRWSRLSLAGAAGAVAFAVVPLTLLPRGGPGELVVQFLDVGQGDAALITTPNGRQVLIDGGPSGIELARELGQVMPHWDRTLDAVIATHPQEDHVAGLAEAIGRFRAAAVYENGRTNVTTAFAVFEKRASARQALEQGSSFQLDGVLFEVLWPPAGYTTDDLNNTSLVIRMTYGKRTFLFTADSEEGVHAELLRSGQLRADVLKVPHHGSQTTQPWFFNAVQPAVAVISAGAGNLYGHPHAQTLQALEGVRTYRTDESGRVTVRTDGATLRVSSER